MDTGLYPVRRGTQRVRVRAQLRFADRGRGTASITSEGHTGRREHSRTLRARPSCSRDKPERVRTSMIGKYSISANFSDEKTMNRPAKLVHSRGDGLSS